MTVALVLLCVPLLAAAVLAIPQTRRFGYWIDLGSAALILAIALTLPWQAASKLGPLHLDRLVALIAMLVAVSAVAPRVNASRQRHHARIAGQIMLAGMLIATLAGDRLLTCFALIMACTAALARDLPAGWFRVPLSGAGSGLLLFGTVLPPSPVGMGCAVLGLATLAAAAPDLLIVLPPLALRLGAESGPVLIGVGTAAILLCADAAVVFRPYERRRLVPVALAHASMVGVAFGIGTPDAVFAGLVMLILLVLVQAAIVQAGYEGPAYLAAAAGLAGVPPLCVFPGLVLVLLAVGRAMPWLLAPLAVSLSVMGWAVITRLPTSRFAWPAGREISPAWVPLAVALLVGFFLPTPAVEWLRAVAAGAR